MSKWRKDSKDEPLLIGEILSYVCANVFFFLRVFEHESMIGWSMQWLRKYWNSIRMK